MLDEYSVYHSESASIITMYDRDRQTDRQDKQTGQAERAEDTQNTAFGGGGKMCETERDERDERVLLAKRGFILNSLSRLLSLNWFVI